MSRGLGSLQRDVLQALRTRGKWIGAQSLTCALYERIQQSDREQVPYSFYVKVRRAATSLVKRNAVKTGMTANTKYGDRTRVAYWLPGQEPPALKRVIEAAVVENTIMQVITGINEVEAEDSFKYGREVVRSMVYDRKPGKVTYTHVVNTVDKLLTRDGWDRERLAVHIHRAVYRLQEKGLLRIRWYAARRIGSVYPVKCCDVNTNVFSATLSGKARAA